MQPELNGMQVSNTLQLTYFNPVLRTIKLSLTHQKCKNKKHFKSSIIIFKIRLLKRHFRRINHNIEKANRKKQTLNLGLGSFLFKFGKKAFTNKKWTNFFKCLSAKKYNIFWLYVNIVLIAETHKNARTSC